MLGSKEEAVEIVVDWDDTCSSQHWHAALQQELIKNLKSQESLQKSLLDKLPASGVSKGQKSYKELTDVPDGVTIHNGEGRFAIQGQSLTNPSGGVSIGRVEQLMKDRPLNMGLVSVLLDAAKQGKKVAIVSYTWYPEAIEIALNLLIDKIPFEEQQAIRRNIRIAGGYPIKGMKEIGKQEHFAALGINGNKLGVYIDDDINNVLVAQKAFPSNKNLFIWPAKKRISKILNQEGALCEELSQEAEKILGEENEEIYFKLKFGHTSFSVDEQKRIDALAIQLQAYVLEKVKVAMKSVPVPKTAQGEGVGLNDMKNLKAIEEQRKKAYNLAQEAYLLEAEKPSKRPAPVLASPIAASSATAVPSSSKPITSAKEYDDIAIAFLNASTNLKWKMVEDGEGISYRADSGEFYDEDGFDNFGIEETIFDATASKAKLEISLIDQGEQISFTSDNLKKYIQECNKSEKSRAKIGDAMRLSEGREAAKPPKKNAPR